MDTECDVDHKLTLSNIMRFPNPPNRRSGRPIRTNLLTIFIIFFSQMDTECDVDRSVGRWFNLSAHYALLMLVQLAFRTLIPITKMLTDRRQIEVNVLMLKKVIKKKGRR